MAGLIIPVGAQEICIACVEPKATYSCTPELPVGNAGTDLGTGLQGKACATVLAKNGGHQSCHAVNTSEPCDGHARTVTLTDYQRAIAGNGQPSTYQPGVLEMARQNVQDTWRCVSSLFDDCQ